MREWWEINKDRVVNGKECRARNGEEGDGGSHLFSRKK